MIKKSLYPKTTRVENNTRVIVTEKLDGSNLVFFKLNDELYIGQRNNIFIFSNIEENKGKLYKGLYQWLIDNGDNLLNELHDQSAICGEWIGMGQIGYGERLDKKFYMFAKANVKDDDFDLTNIIYKQNLFVYPFVNQEIPDYIGTVAVVGILSTYPSVEQLDTLYASYSDDTKDSLVEGFVVYNERENTIAKYVRRKGKGGQLQDHLHKGAKHEN